MEAYKKFVRRNREFVQSLESLANGITWLLPERFSNSEIGPEAVYAFLGIVGAVNQHILDTAPCRTRQPGSRDSSAFPWSLCVSTLKDLETVVEVAAQYFYGDDGKWDFIAAMEAIKVFVRLASFRDSGCKMLLRGGEIVEAEKGKEVSGFHNGRAGDPYYQGYMSPHLEKRAMAALRRFGDDTKMWWQKLVQSSEAPAFPIKDSFCSIWSEKGLLGRLFLTGEVLYIMRPLVYVLMIRKYGIRSWLPWTLSLAVDVTGLGFISLATKPGHRGKESVYQLSSSERDEVKRRKVILALYIMRDPFFAKYTKHRLEMAEKYLSPIPLIGFLSGKLVELLIGAQTRYAYTSGS